MARVFQPLSGAQMPMDPASLLARRVPADEVMVGHAYVIHARRGGVGVAVRDEAGLLGYRLHREKFGRHFLFTEFDWSTSEFNGTAIPLRLLPDVPPTDEDALLGWLADREAENEPEIRAAWREVIGDDLVERRSSFK